MKNRNNRLKFAVLELFPHQYEFCHKVGQVSVFYLSGGRGLSGHKPTNYPERLKPKNFPGQAGEVWREAALQARRPGSLY